MKPDFAVELTESAENDLEELYIYLATNRSPEAAATLLDRLLGKVESLEHFPARGAVPSELAALGIREFRQRVLPPYRLVYRSIDDRVLIMLVADGRRDTQTLLEARLLGR